MEKAKMASDWSRQMSRILSA